MNLVKNSEIRCDCKAEGRSKMFNIGVSSLLRRPAATVSVDLVRTYVRCFWAKSNRFPHYGHIANYQKLNNHSKNQKASAKIV